MSPPISVNATVAEVLSFAEMSRSGKHVNVDLELNLISTQDVDRQRGAIRPGCDNLAEHRNQSAVPLCDPMHSADLGRLPFLPGLAREIDDQRDEFGLGGGLVEEGLDSGFQPPDHVGHLLIRERRGKGSEDHDQRALGIDEGHHVQQIDTSILIDIATFVILVLA